MFKSISGTVRYVFSSMVAIVLFAISLQAQSTGTVRGKVVDPLGKLVPNAKLVLVQDDKDIVEGKSDAEGSFSLPVPSDGRYSLRVEAAGFATQVDSNVLVTLSQKRRTEGIVEHRTIGTTGRCIGDWHGHSGITSRSLDFRH